MLAPGRTLGVAVYRPFAEQLAALAAPRDGDRVLELSAGDGELTGRLRAAVGARGDVVVAQRPWRLPGGAGRYDLAVSLLALEAAEELTAVLRDVARVTDRALIAVWAGEPVYDHALRAAWLDVAGAVPDVLAPSPLLAPPPGWQQGRLSDVARFDGVDHLLMALTDERGIEVAASQRAALRDRLAHHLATSIAADGTMRIPVHVMLLGRG